MRWFRRLTIGIFFTCSKSSKPGMLRYRLLRHRRLGWPGAACCSSTKGKMRVKGFRDFISRGNVIDLAVAVVIGTAFTAVVTALVTDLITPLIAAIGGQPHFQDLSFKVHKSTFLYGAFLNAIITFLIL